MNAGCVDITILRHTGHLEPIFNTQSAQTQTWPQFSKITSLGFVKHTVQI